MAELLAHEALVQEAYLDSQGVWTWGVGLTAASGHDVYPRYQDAPQPLSTCLAVFLEIIHAKYWPEVQAAFPGQTLSEAQWAAALSFHYNTGRIARAAWVDDWTGGDVDAARAAFMNWCKPPEILTRRGRERDLFFDGVWSGDGCALVFPVEKPSYRPDFEAGERVEILSVLDRLMGG